MTRVRKTFLLQRPLSVEQTEKLAARSSVYGILRIEVAPGGAELHIDFDATRLCDANVTAVLESAGIPVA